MFRFLKTIRLKAVRTSWLHGKLIYWALLEFSKKIKFRIRNYLFQFVYWRKEKVEDSSILLYLVRKSLFGIVLVCLLVYVAHTIENSFPSVFSGFKGDISSIYEALVQVAGLIVGLYFTAISVVFSTTYSKVPDDVRMLIAREKLGDQYIEILMLSGAISLIELGVISLGYSASKIIFYISLFLSLTSFLTLPVLIRNTFHFFNPARLAEAYIFPDVLYWTKMAVCGGHGWNDPPFQFHYYRRASEALTTYDRIIDLLISSERPNTSSLINLLTSELSFLSYYTRLKGQIPLNSRWYQYRAEYPKWFEATSSTVEIAMNANISLPHKEVPNHLWIEERVARNLKKVFECLFKSSDLEESLELLQILQSSCTNIVKSLSLKEAYFLTKVRDGLLMDYLVNSKTVESNNRYFIALADFYGADHVSIPIEYGKILKDISPPELKNKLRRVDWNNSASVYKTLFPFSILNSLEDILERKKNQHLVEKDCIVPEWYDLELISIACLKFLNETAREVVSQYEDAFLNSIKLLQGDDKNLCLLQIITRGLEGFQKVTTFLNMATSIEKELQDLIVVKDIPHPKIKWDEYSDKANKVRDQLIDTFGTLAQKLEPGKFDNTLPDYFGQAYWVLARECFLALCDGNESRYGKLYALYIPLVYTAWGYMQQILAKNENVDYYASVFSEIFIDVMAIGGFAKLFSELRNGKYWTITTNVWDSLIKSSSSKSVQQFFDPFLAAARYKSTPWLTGITSRSMERSGWGTRFNFILRKESGITDDDDDIFMRKARTKISSPLLRTFGGSGMHHPESVFVNFYVLEKPEMKETQPELDNYTAQFIESYKHTLERDARNDK